MRESSSPVATAAAGRCRKSCCSPRPTVSAPCRRCPSLCATQPWQSPGRGAGQRVLLLGSESGGVATTAVQEIDPASGSVRVVAHLPAAR